MRTVARRPHEEHRPRPSFTRVNEGAGRCLLPLAAARSRHGNDPHSAAAAPNLGSSTDSVRGSGAAVIWAVLIALGVPLWLCACGILTLVFRNRSLRKRPGNVPCKFRPTDKKRWTSGHGVWVSDVFAWGGSTAAWKSELAWATGLATRPADDGERKKLRRLGDSPLIASLALAEGGTVEVAAKREHRAGLLGPFGDGAADVGADGDTR